MESLKQPSLGREVLLYLRRYRRWWMLPMIVVILLFAILTIVGEVAPIVSPFIYTLF